MSTSHFFPAPRFGVPFSTFPPGISWKTLEDMLHEVMTDLHRTWIQDFLLRPNPQFGADLLSSTTQLSKALPVTCVIDKNCRTELIVPAFTKDDVTVGVTLVTVPNRMKYGFRNDSTISHCFSHFVQNRRTGARCFVTIDEERDAVELNFFQCMRYVTLRFHRHPFLQAFSSGNVNFGRLQNCIMSSLVAYSTRHLWGCSCGSKHCVDCWGTRSLSSYLPDFNSEVGPGPFGDYVSKMVYATFKDSNPVDSFPVFTSVSRTYGLHRSSWDEKVIWGLTDRLRRRTPVVPYAFFVQDNGEVAPVSHGDARARRDDTNHDSHAIERRLCEIDNLLLGFPSNYVDASHSISLSAVECEPIVCSDASVVLVPFDRTTNARGVPPQEIYPAEATGGGCDPSLTAESETDLGSQASNELWCQTRMDKALKWRGENRRLRRIAPAPVPLEEQVSRTDVIQSLETQRLEKLELKKLRKREAAARGNERRRLLRLARLAQNDGIEEHTGPR